MEIALGVISAAIAIITAIATYDTNRRQQELQRQETDEATRIANEQVSTQKDIANQNLDLQTQQFEYQKQLNELQMQREDTAMQRQVADLKKAGLSPLMASGGAQTGNLISASAPQMDGSGILSAMSNVLGVKTDSLNRKQNAYQFQRQQNLQMAQTFADLQEKRLQNKKLYAEIDAQNIANEYNREHGLRDPSVEQALVDAFSRLIADRKIDVSDVNEALDNAKNKVSSNVKDEIVKPIVSSITKGKDAVVDSTKIVTNPLVKAWKKTPIYNGYKKVQQVYQNYKNK